MDKALYYFCKAWKHSTKFKLYISALYGFILYQAWTLTSQEFVSGRDVTEFLFYAPALAIGGIFWFAELATHDWQVMEKIKNDHS